MNKQHLVAQAILRSWPFPRGAGRLLDKYFSNLAFSKSIETVSTTDGFAMRVDPNDLIGKHLYLIGEFDRSIIEILHNFSEPTDVLLDIGANIGYVSGCFLKRNLDAQVIAVEPQPGVLDLLKANLAQFGRYKIYPFALGDHDGEVAFSIDTSNKGASRVSSSGAARIPMKSTSSLFQELNIAKLDLVKIDAEGSEESILRSGAAQLERFHPRAILFEELHKGECQRILTSIGYRMFGVKKTLNRLKLEPVEDRSGAYHEYIAISPRRPVPIAAQRAYKIQ